MTRRKLFLLPLTLLPLAFGPGNPSAQLLRSAYAAPLAAPSRPLRVFHLGHSLVGRDMPAMLAQLAGAGHRYESQLGWGTSLRAHWEDDVPIKGFRIENAHPRFRPADQAIASGDYDAVILTEMVELRDAIRYHDSANYLTRWANLARAADPDTRIYLYETWHRTDDPDGWLARLDGDLATLWEARLLAPDLRAGKGRNPIRVIPAGQVMAAFVRRVEAEGGIGPIRDRFDLFARQEDGTTDPIHINDFGAYLVALTHYAVLYHRSTAGLPHALRRADGQPAADPGADAARAMQEIVWQVVTAYDKTGVRQ